MKRVLAALHSTVLIVGITTILLLIIVIGGEYWLRRGAQYKPWREVEIEAVNQTFAYHPWAAFRNTPGFRYIVGDLNLVKINKYGWRGPEPKIERPKNVKRAILLGDSVAFSGWGCREGVTLGGAMTRALELRTGEEWEVINMAVGGGFSSVSLATLAHEGMQFKPDAVVTLNGTNDLLVMEPAANWISIGKPESRFKTVLYHGIQEKLENLYDPRTGRFNQTEMIDQLLSQSALFTKLKTMVNINLRPVPVGEQTTAVKVGMVATRSTDHLERLDNYINNEIAMSYLAAGGGATFIAFLQPYLSLKHKVVGDIDRALIVDLTKTNPGMLEWLDKATPLVGEKLAAAAATHATLNYVDISHMFTTEQVFSDAMHMLCLSGSVSMPGNELMAARMADEIVKRVYAGKILPNWRENHIEGSPHDWNDRAYLDANPDVAELVKAGKYASGYAHYIDVGFLKGRPGGFPGWNENAYLEANPDVAAAVKAGRFASGYDHYLQIGRAEGRLKGLRPRWIEESYLRANPDVAAAIKSGHFASGLDHYKKAGALEGRIGGFSGWDEEGYLLANGDVRAAVASGTFKSGLDHYVQAGAAERRPIRLGTYVPRE